MVDMFRQPCGLLIDDVAEARLALGSRVVKFLLGNRRRRGVGPPTIPPRINADEDIALLDFVEADGGGLISAAAEIFHRRELALHAEQDFVDRGAVRSQVDVGRTHKNLHLRDLHAILECYCVRRPSLVGPKNDQKCNRSRTYTQNRSNRKPRDAASF